MQFFQRLTDEHKSVNLKTHLESLPSFLFSSTAVLLAAIVGRIEIFFLCGRALMHVNQTEENTASFKGPFR